MGICFTRVLVGRMQLCVLHLLILFMVVSSLLSPLAINFSTFRYYAPLEYYPGNLFHPKLISPARNTSFRNFFSNQIFKKSVKCLEHHILKFVQLDYLSNPMYSSAVGGSVCSRMCVCVFMWRSGAKSTPP